MRCLTKILLSLTLFTLLGAWNRAAGAADGEWKSLFNGKDLTGWEVVGKEPEEWLVQDGIIHCKGIKNVNWLATKDEYANFEVSLEFRLQDGGNSGVFLRSALKGNPAVDAMEIQLLDDDSPHYAKIKPWQHIASLYGLSAAKLGAAKKAGEWQKIDILCDHKHVKVTLNDVPVTDANLDDYNDRVTKKDGLDAHPGVLRTTGRIGLQNHSGPLDFRNLKVKVLP